MRQQIIHVTIVPYVMAGRESSQVKVICQTIQTPGKSYTEQEARKQA